MLCSKWRLPFPIPTFQTQHQDLQALIGKYERRPVTNGWHEVTISIAAGGAEWRNAAEAVWAVEAAGEAWVCPASPYGHQVMISARASVRE